MQDRRTFRIDHLYRQVAEELIRRIMMGEWREGDAPPADADLASELGVSAGTVRRSFEILSELGLVLRGKGRGTVVGSVLQARKYSPLHQIYSRDGEKVVGDIEVRDANLEDADDILAARLRLRSKRQVIRCLRVRSYQGRPFMWEDVVLPILVELTDDETSDLRKAADQIWWRREISMGKKETVRSDVATERDQALLDVAIGSSVLCLNQTLFGYRDRVLEIRSARCVLPPDLEFVIDRMIVDR